MYSCRFYSGVLMGWGVGAWSPAWGKSWTSPPGGTLFPGGTSDETGSAAGIFGLGDCLRMGLGGWEGAQMQALWHWTPGARDPQDVTEILLCMLGQKCKEIQCLPLVLRGWVLFLFVWWGCCSTPVMFYQMP